MSKKKLLADDAIAIRLPHKLLERFQRKCEETERTMSEVIREALRKYLEQHED